MKRLRLPECRIEPKFGTLHLTIRKHLNIVSLRVKQLRNEFDTDLVRQAAIADDGPALDQRRALIGRDVRDSHERFRTPDVLSLIAMRRVRSVAAAHSS